MKFEYFRDMYLGLVNEALQISRAKGYDYANEDDTLLNFKGTAGLARLTGYPDTDDQREAWDKVLLKIHRLGNVKDKMPKNEDKRQNFLDLINYLFLWWAVQVEKDMPEGYDKRRRKEDEYAC